MKRIFEQEIPEGNREFLSPFPPFPPVKKAYS
jgi:hypothetical protein